MKLRLLALSTFSLLLAVNARAENYDFKDVVTRTGAFGATGSVTLENVNGSIEIRTWEKNEIVIEAEKSAKTDEELGLIDLKIELTGSEAVIKVRLPKRTGGFFGGSGGNIRASVRFKLTVPATVTLDKISTVNSSVTIDGVRGAMNVSSVNGGVRATNLGGDANLGTVNGEIRAEFSDVVANQKLSFHTVNGAVVVRLPKDAGLELRGSVVNGRIDCDFPLESGTKGGRRSLSGKIGDGRASLQAETVNGSIHLKSL